MPLPLDLLVAHGLRAAPTWVDPVIAVLQERGIEHEQRYAEGLRAEGLGVVDLATRGGEEAVQLTREAMRAGRDVILQAALRTDPWFGRPDILRRVETPSELGAWSYEVIDTKLARETRGGTILQLALYSDLLATCQGRAPESFHVVTPDPESPVQSFRVHDFAAYFRLVQRRLSGAVGSEPRALAGAHYPEPVEHCDMCRWWSTCGRRRRDDDHLSLVAGLSRLQGRELQSAGVATVAALASLPLPLPIKPRRGAIETYVRVREQARVQVEGRVRRAPVHELLAIEPGQGLARLPEPSRGDIFLDLEGDPFAREGGREYLFGFAVLDGGRGRDAGPAAYHARWAWTDAGERAAFEATVDSILGAWESHPGMHVYHYAPYEPAALKRLMGRYATREAEVDRMLRAGLFVDLHAVVKHAVRASVERYSIKDLEPFYEFARAVPLADARTSLGITERALELGTPELVTEADRAVVEAYNRDDCLSALELRGWLERLRAGVEASGTPVPRPAPGEDAAPETVGERARRVQALIPALTTDVPLDRDGRTDEQEARWLLAHLLDWHRREDKAPWWEFFRLRDLSEEELADERAAIAGMRHVERLPGGTARCPIDRYAYPPQDTDVRREDELHLPDGTGFGKVVAIDRARRWLDVKKTSAHAETHPAAVFAHTFVNSDVLAEALIRLGSDVVEHGITGGDRYQPARQLLMCRAPRLRDGAFEAQPGETALEFAVRIAPLLDRTVLAIQGPPGAGKTWTGAEMIAALVARGARVGVAAVSHKVIRNLLDAVRKAGDRAGRDIVCVHKVNTRNGDASDIEEITDNAAALARLASGTAQVVGGTAWLWARPEAEGALDVLFVDEAGQMSLANVLAASGAARSVVLLGDPQQLEQPQQGSHPEGADRSALEHVLGGRKTMPSDRGIFLSETWRLAPRICDFTSEVFYEGRLRPREGLERQALLGAGPFDGAGLHVVEVEHAGNRNSSPEEVDAVERVVDRLLQDGVQWTDAHGTRRPMSARDILVVAPYNAHVALLAERLEPRDIRVGTVDRFQGQEAPVVIYSMATSTPEDAPRGMEFLYSLNRLNVATSRARCAAILVASPRLFEPECRSPRQMQLANAMCRYLEMARVVDGAGPGFAP